MTQYPNRDSYRMGDRYGRHPDDGEYPGAIDYCGGNRRIGEEYADRSVGQMAGQHESGDGFYRMEFVADCAQHDAPGKEGRLLTPMSFSLIHAADFANRVNTQIRPALKAGATVLADRYVFTAFDRDAARGVDRDRLRRVYSFAIQPSLAFYFKVPLEESIRRITIGREGIGYYESGQDMGLAGNRADSFRQFQGRLLEEHSALTEEYGLITIDATQPIVKQQRVVRKYVEPLIKGTMRIHGQSVPEALGSSGLTGRYMRAPGSRKQDARGGATDT